VQPSILWHAGTEIKTLQSDSTDKLLSTKETCRSCYKQGGGQASQRHLQLQPNFILCVKLQIQICEAYRREKDHSKRQINIGVEREIHCPRALGIKWKVNGWQGFKQSSDKKVSCARGHKCRLSYGLDPEVAALMVGRT
jgi:hypothetical protein